MREERGGTARQDRRHPSAGGREIRTAHAVDAAVEAKEPPLPCPTCNGGLGEPERLELGACDHAVAGLRKGHDCRVPRKLMTKGDLWSCFVEGLRHGPECGRPSVTRGL